MAITGLRNKMLELAYRMIVEDGIENFTVKSLSKKLNISHNTMYRHFRSKADLVNTLLEEEFKNMAAATLAVIQRDDLDNMDKYRECAYCSLEFAVSKPCIYKLMFATEFKKEDVSESFIKEYSRYYNHLLELVQECIESGEIENGTKYSVLNTTWGLLHGLAMLLIDNILPLNKNMDSIPRPLGSSNFSTEQVAGADSIREIVGFSVDAFLDSIFSGKKSRSRFKFK